MPTTWSSLFCWWYIRQTIISRDIENLCLQEVKEKKSLLTIVIAEVLALLYGRFMSTSITLANYFLNVSGLISFIKREFLKIV